MKIVFVTSGWARLNSGLGPMDVEAGSIVAFPAGVWCSADPVGGVETVTLYTQSDYVSTQLRWMPPAHPLTHHLRSAATEGQALGALSIGKTQMRTLAPKLLSLASVGQQQGQEFTVLTLVSSLLDDIARIAGSTHDAAHDAPPALIPRREVAQAVRALRADLRHPWTLRALATRVSLSESQLTRLFRNELGISPGALLWQMRTDRVAELLATTPLTATEAFRQAGWASQSAASRAFKRRFGVGPREYSSRIRHLGPGQANAEEGARPTTSLSSLLVDS
ncbi:AraC family transcriptional regulator [Georgenia sp. TF02-10]|uniref:helix-turn-helix transcriptional regulator n=1 Tax=Georgenia sp. TF02-10 TaxID=2917725 RepID=UPI001FA748AB|nr:AraC family transcriptional regulator [Georgenia sp. TF02-10]UNX53573.1 AraC family transcriptional regulator [Georgenia sp. TF02-10]